MTAMQRKKQRTTIRLYLERTRTYRNWFARLPKKAIDLDVVLDFTNDKDAHRVGALHTPCNSAGCVVGWLEHYLCKKKIHELSGNYLGLSRFQCDGDNVLFSASREWDKTPRQEALDRLQRRITGLEARLKVRR